MAAGRQQARRDTAGFALLLKFFESEARFPRDLRELPAAAVAYVAEQVKVSASLLSEYGWSDRTATYHRTQIREAFGFRTLTRDDETKLAEWLAVVPEDVVHPGLPGDWLVSKRSPRWGAYG